MFARAAAQGFVDLSNFVADFLLTARPGVTMSVRCLSASLRANDADGRKYRGGEIRPQAISIQLSAFSHKTGLAKVVADR
jgi:hypothetical protein